MLKALLDMDGVLVSFVQGALAVHEKDYPYNRPEAAGHWNITTLIDIPEDKFWRPMEDLFWARLKKTPEADEIVDLVVGKFGLDNTCLLSVPSPNIGCVPGKLQWIAENYPQFSDRYLFGPRKEFASGPNRILIDDRDKNVDDFNRAGGTAFLLPRPWNRMHKSRHEPVKHLKAFLHSI